ncbi:AfsR/SARP family transcriptional regulator [Nonomuraea endophytica]|uniref:DNA-binding SARP family transcriptional activator n=1 Tax=Nonomuraea endophytica TaxID=714136 RepID=A0A7W8EE45_9ACTN|nr:AfsR/SARP family transcriptional regulator [Nonomuraea endophytica]MBB5074982.1 DNA-binding SARP family transcriptional activator [Nonomuraea endophytica]
MFRVLGPLEITVGERLAQPPGPRQRELLALLLLRANQVVSIGTIVRLAWGERPPPTARRQAQNCVGRLRRLMTDVGLSPKTIVTTPGGYLLKVADDQLDMLAFLARADEGRALAGAGHVWKASRRYRSALALWRGPAFDGVELGPLTGEVERLDERRLAVLEDCLDLELKLGKHAAVADELAVLVSRHPLRERMWGQMVLALYRCGREHEALIALERARARARFEPGERLLEIEAAILRGDAGVPERPGRLPADLPDFTGREEETGALAALLSREAGAVVSGEPGIGKTALAVHVAHRVNGSYPDGQLFASLRGSGPAEVLAGFLRRLGVPGHAVPDGIEERAELYRNKLAGRRALIVLDDVADAAQARPLLPEAPRCAVLITSRSGLDELTGGSRLPGLGGMSAGSVLPGLGGLADEAFRSEPGGMAEGAFRSGLGDATAGPPGSGPLPARPAWPAWAGMSGFGARQSRPSAPRAGLSLVELAPLENGPAMTLLAKIAGAGRVAAEVAAARDLVRHCGGSPLAIRVAAARLTAEPRLPVSWMADRLSGHAIPRTPRSDGQDPEALGWPAAEVLGLGYAGLPEPAQRLLRLTGLVEAPDFAPWVCAALLDADLAEAEEMAERLVEAQLLERTGPARYRLQDVVRRFAARRTGGDERAEALGRLLDGWLVLADQANGLRFGGGSGPPEGRWTPKGVAVGDPADWFESERPGLVSAVRQAAAEGRAEHCCRLAVALARFLEGAGHLDDLAECLRLALAANPQSEPGHTWAL